MPYNHPNIKYGLPHEEYPRERINECIDSLKEVIDLKREPVGITLLFTKEDIQIIRTLMCFNTPTKRAVSRYFIQLLEN